MYFNRYATERFRISRHYLHVLLAWIRYGGCVFFPAIDTTLWRCVARDVTIFSSNSQSNHVAIASSHTSAYSNAFVFVPSQPNGRDSDCLRDRSSGDSIPVGERFPAPVQTGTGAQPASFTIRTGSFPGVKRPGRDVAHPHLEQRLKKDSIPVGERFLALGLNQPPLQSVPAHSRG